MLAILIKTFNLLPILPQSWVDYNTEIVHSLYKFNTICSLLQHEQLNTEVVHIQVDKTIDTKQNINAK